MPPKMGRPKVENPKDIRFSIRLDAGTQAKLKEFCEAQGMTRTEAIRKGIDLLLAEKK